MGCGLSQPESQVVPSTKQQRISIKEMEVSEANTQKHMNCSLTTDCKTPSNNLAMMRSSQKFNSDLTQVEDENEDESEVIKQMLHTIEQQIPQKKVTEKYINARKSFRIKENLSENPAPIISKNLYNSRLFKKRSILISQIENQELEN